MTTLAEKIAVMQAAERGEKIQAADRGSPNNWQDAATPLWCWDSYNYRVKPVDPLRKLTVEEAANAEWVWYLSPLSHCGFYKISSTHQAVCIAKRGEAFATEEGAEAEVLRRWGGKL